MLTYQGYQRELESSPFHPLKRGTIVSMTRRPDENLTYKTVGAEIWVPMAQEIDTERDLFNTE